MWFSAIRLYASLAGASKLVTSHPNSCSSRITENQCRDYSLTFARFVYPNWQRDDLAYGCFEYTSNLLTDPSLPHEPGSAKWHRRYDVPWGSRIVGFNAIRGSFPWLFIRRRGARAGRQPVQSAAEPAEILQKVSKQFANFC